MTSLKEAEERGQKRGHRQYGDFWDQGRDHAEELYLGLVLAPIGRQKFLLPSSLSLSSLLSLSSHFFSRVSSLFSLPCSFLARVCAL